MPLVNPRDRFVLEHLVACGRIGPADARVLAGRDLGGQPIEAVLLREGVITASQIIEIVKAREAAGVPAGTPPPELSLSPPLTDSTPTDAASAERDTAEFGALDLGVPFGSYLIEREVARGGMGIVYEARHKAMRRRVALKVLIKVDASERERLRFQREVRTVAALRHPNIVTVYDTGEAAVREGEEPRPYIAMEFLDGWTLEKLLLEGLDWWDASAIVRDCARAMDYAHAQGVIHRDLKPQNIIVDDARVPRITDFGLAKTQGMEDRLTRTGTIIGTPVYMAPEQLRGKVHELDGRCDLYALGVILYQTIAGDVPYAARSPVELLRLQEKGPPPPPSQGVLHRVPPAERWAVEALDQIVLRAIALDRDRRYARGNDLADDLARLLEERERRLGHPGEAPAVAPGARGRRAVVRGVAVVAGVAAAALLGGFYIAGRDPGGGPPAEPAPVAPPPAPAPVEPGPEARAAEVREARHLVLEASRLCWLEDGAAATGVLVDLAARPGGQTLALVFRAELDFRRGSLQGLSAMLDALVSDAPGDPIPLVARGQLRLDLGDLAAGIVDLDRAIALDPDDPWPHVQRAAGLLRLERFAEALAAADRAAAIAPDEPEVVTTRAFALFRSGDAGGGIDYLSRHVETFPDDILAWMVLGDLLSTRGSQHEADAAFAAALRQGPACIGLLKARGLARERADRDAEALDDFRAYIAAGGRDPEAYYRAAQISNRLGHRDQSLVDTGLATDPDHPGCLSLRAERELDTGDFRAAFADIDRALSIKSDRAAWFNIRGRCRLRLDQNDEAADDFARAQALAPQNMAYRVNRGLALIQGQRFADARTVLMEARNVNARDPRPVRALALCLIASSPVRDVAQARSLADEVERLDPNDADTWYVSARVHQASNDRPGAIERIRRAIELAGPDDDLATLRAFAETLARP